MAYIQSLAHRVYNFAPGNGTREYLGVIHVGEVDPEPKSALVFFHGGGFTGGDMFRIQPAFLAIAAATRSPIVSVEYPLIRSTETFDATRASVDRAVAYIRTHLFPRAALIASGVSSGGTIAIDTVFRHPNAFVALLADSPVLCVDTVPSQIQTTARTCKAENVNIDSMDYVLNTIRPYDVCYIERTPPVPTMLLLSRMPDLIIPEENALPWIDPPIANVDSCRDRFGSHGFALTVYGGCLSTVAEWLQRHASADEHVERDLHRELIPYEFRHVAMWAATEVAFTVGATTPACRQLCGLFGRDPFDLYAYACSSDAQRDDGLFGDFDSSQ